MFSPLYAMLAVLDIVNEILEISLPIWSITLALYVFISVTIFRAVQKYGLEPNLKFRQEE